MLAVSVVKAETIRRDWMVMSMTGTVEFNDTAKHKLNAQKGTMLAAPFTIVTGEDGHAEVSQGEDELRVEPNSRVEVPQPFVAEAGVTTRIRQTLGSVLYHVQHRIKDSFEVDTPYLVSVVKGTTFNIRTTADDSTVALIEGKLWIHTPDLKSEVILKPGQAAIKSRLGSSIIVKDQQSLSSLQKGPITVANDRSGSTAVSSGKQGITSKSVSDIGAASDIRAFSPNEDVTSLGDIRTLDLGAKLDSGNLIDLRTNVTTTSASAAISSGSVLDLGAGIGSVSTSSSISGGSILDVGTSVGGISTTTTVGGSSVLDVGASVGSVSTNASIGGNGLIDVGASIGDSSANLSVGGSSLIDLGSGTTGIASGTSGSPAATTSTTTTSTTTSQVPAVGGVLGNTLSLPGL